MNKQGAVRGNRNRAEDAGVFERTGELMTDKMCIKCHKDNQWFRSEFCFSCMNEENEKKLTNDILSGEVEETEYEDDIVCPWCGTRYDSFDVDENHLFMDEFEHTTDCGECGHDFVYQADVSITFSTRRE